MTCHRLSYFKMRLGGSEDGRSSYGLREQRRTVRQQRNSPVTNLYYGKKFIDLRLNSKFMKYSNWSMCELSLNLWTFCQGLDHDHLASAQV